MTRQPVAYRGRHRRGRTASSLIAATVVAAATIPAVLLTAAPGAEAAVCPSAPVKCYRVDLAPASFVAGSTAQVTASIKNESGGQSLGSSNLTAPSGYTISHLGTPSRGTATQVGQQIQFRNLALPVGQSATVTFTLQTPNTAASSPWTSTAKQSNDYNGTGNDFVLDPASARTTTTTTTTTGNGSTAGCPSTDVSCGTNFIRYDRASFVSTGSTASANIWLVARIDFPATGVSGGQLYTLDAPSHPTANCPVNGVPQQCTFEVDAQVIPTPYDAAHPATLAITCDITRCNPSNLYLMFKQTDSGAVQTLLPCPSVGGDPCYTQGAASDGDAVITIQNITAGDPKFLGIAV
jgi:hypothetical protein